MKNRFVTVMFDIKDQEKFKVLFSELCNSLGGDELVSGAAVVAIAKEDLFSKIERYEDQLIGLGADESVDYQDDSMIK